MGDGGGGGGWGSVGGWGGERDSCVDGGAQGCGVGVEEGGHTRDGFGEGAVELLFGEVRGPEAPIACCGLSDAVLLVCDEAGESDELAGEDVGLGPEWGIRVGVYISVAVGEGELESVVFFVVEGGFKSVGGGGAGGGARGDVDVHEGGGGLGFGNFQFEEVGVEAADEVVVLSES